MKGLELSRRYFYELAYPELKKYASDILPYMACGLVGEGSECFGLDDDLSTDHDFGPGFCIWLPEEIYNKYYSKLEEILKRLPNEFCSYKRIESVGADKRIGVFSIESFYEKYTNKREFPLNDDSWLKIPEDFLATCTNGEIYLDNYKEFSDIRNYLKKFYPEDVFKKKISAYLAKMAQAGQYNLLRSLKRNDKNAVFFSKAEFLESCFACLYLISKTYMPYYKLRGKHLQKMNYYPEELFEDIYRIQETNEILEIEKLVEKICKYIADILRFRNYIKTDENFLIVAANEILNTIENPSLKNMHIMKGNNNG